MNKSQRYLFTATCLCAALCMPAQRIVCDDNCKTEFAQSPTTSGNPMSGLNTDVRYAVVSPVGHSTVDMIQMAPRLTSL